VRVNNPDEAGFALVELMIALVIGGMVILAARAMLMQLSRATDDVTVESRAMAEAANSERVLRGLVSSIASSDSDGPAVIGDRAVARFRTWCDTPGGWQEPCAAELRIVAWADTNAAVLTAGAESYVVRRGFRAGSVIYLVDPRGGGSWLAAWHSQITTPTALGLVIDGDTLILRVGERG